MINWVKWDASIGREHIFQELLTRPLKRSDTCGIMENICKYNTSTLLYLIVLSMFPPPFFCWSKNIIFDKIQISTTFLFGRSRLSHLTGVFQEVAVLELLNAWDLMDTNTSQRFFRRRVLPVTAELGKGTAVSSGQGFPRQK